MRKGYDGLSGLVRNELGADPLSGDVYVFFSRNRRSFKLLVWDRDGFVVYSKRLERGCYEQLSGIIEKKAFMPLINSLLIEVNMVNTLLSA